MAKQQVLKEIRDYKRNPRSGHEDPDPAFRNDIDFTGEVSLTKQSEAESADINFIMKRYEQTGFLPDNSGKMPIYEDFSTMETFQEALQIVSSANATFHSLPAEIRARFQNDPAQFLGFVEAGQTDPKVGDELIKMGLAVPREQAPAPKKDAKEPVSAASKAE